MVRKPFTEEDKRIIEKYYPIKTPAEVAAMIGRTKDTVCGYACRNKIQSNRYWTKEEEEFLESKYGILTIPAIAKKLGKTECAVETKIRRSSIGSFISNADGLCISEVARLVGRDRTSITKTWMRRYGLKTYQKGQYKIIKEKDLIRFMKENPERWNATECETWFFERFDWFREKRKKDLDAMCRSRWNVSENVCKAN